MHDLQTMLKLGYKSLASETLRQLNDVYLDLQPLPREFAVLFALLSQGDINQEGNNRNK